MTTAQPTRRAAGATADADANRYAGGAGKYSLDVQNANPSAPPPWIRLFVADFITMTRDLRAVEVGIFIQLVAHMHQRGEPIGEDHSRLARLCGADARTFTKTLAMFLADGRIVRKDGGLWSDLVQKEIEHRKNVSDVRSKNARQRWEKDQENQRSEYAKAYRDSESRGIEVREGNNPRQDYSHSSDPHRASSQVVGETLRSAPDGAPRVSYTKGESIVVEDAPCTITGVSSDLLSIIYENGGLAGEVPRHPHTGLALVDEVAWLGRVTSSEDSEMDDEIPF